jgi:hypothetical protein
MFQAAATLTIMLIVAVAVAATFLHKDDGLLLVFTVAGVAAGALYLLGANLNTAADSLPPLLLIAGYAAFAGVLTASNFTKVLATRLGSGPLPVLLLSAAASIFLSNDIVIVALASLVMQRDSRVADSAALLVGANMTGALLPQGTPKNLLLLGGDIPFADYIRISVPVTLVLSAAAICVFLLWQYLVPSLDPDRTDGGIATPLSPRHRALAWVAAGAIIAQPVADALGMPRAVFGWALLSFSLVLGRALGVPAAKVAGAVPWQLAPVVLGVAAGASLLGSDAGGATASAGLVTFFVSSLATDLVGATLAAPLVAGGSISASVALAVTTAAAYATPVGSVAGVLLLQETQLAGKRPELLTFIIAGSAALASLLLATAVLPLLERLW